jgi:ATP-dependent Lon protease
VIWVATANDARAIPDPILNRMSVYEVLAPDRDAARAIALRLYASLRNGHDWGQRFADAPAEAVLERMSELAPRDMRRAWTAAFGNARLDGRDQVEVSDLPSGHPAGKRGPLGFVSH